MSYVPPNKRDNSFHTAEFPPNYRFHPSSQRPNFRTHNEDVSTQANQSTYSFSRRRAAPDGYRSGRKGGYVADHPVVHTSSNCVSKILVATYKDTEAYLNFVPYNYRSYLHLDDRDLYTIVDSNSTANLKNHEEGNVFTETSEINAKENQDSPKNNEKNIQNQTQIKKNQDAQDDNTEVTTEASQQIPESNTSENENINNKLQPNSKETNVNVQQNVQETNKNVQENVQQANTNVQDNVQQTNKNAQENVQQTNKNVQENVQENVQQNVQDNASQISNLEQKFYDLFIDSESEFKEVKSNQAEEEKNKEREFFLSLLPPPGESELTSLYSLSTPSCKQIKILYYKLLTFLQEALHNVHAFLSNPTKGHFHVKLLMRCGKILYHGKSSRYSRLDRFESISTTQFEQNLENRKKFNKTFETNIGEDCYERIKKKMDMDAHSKKLNEKYVIAFQDANYDNDVLRMVFYVKKSQVHYHTGKVETHSQLVLRKVEFSSERYMVIDINRLNKEIDQRFILYHQYQLKDLDKETKQLIDAFLKYSKIDYTLKGGLYLHPNFEHFIGSLSDRFKIKTIRHVSKLIYYVESQKICMLNDSSFEYDLKSGRKIFGFEIIPVAWRRLLKSERKKRKEESNDERQREFSDEVPKWSVENIQKEFYPLLAFCEKHLP